MRWACRSQLPAQLVQLHCRPGTAHMVSPYCETGLLFKEPYELASNQSCLRLCGYHIRQAGFTSNRTCLSSFMMLLLFAYRRVLGTYTLKAVCMGP